MIEQSYGLSVATTQAILALERNLPLDAVTALAAAFAAVVTVWVMMLMTADAGLCTPVARYRLAQRIGFALLAAALGFKAAAPAAGWDARLLADLTVTAALIVVLIPCGLLHCYRRKHRLPA